MTNKIASWYEIHFYTQLHLDWKSKVIDAFKAINFEGSKIKGLLRCDGADFLDTFKCQWDLSTSTPNPPPPSPLI